MDAQKGLKMCKNVHKIHLTHMYKNILFLKVQYNQFGSVLSFPENRTQTKIFGFEKLKPIYRLFLFAGSFLFTPWNDYEKHLNDSNKATFLMLVIMILKLQKNYEKLVAYGMIN